uniref:Uncharacterized protein n=1 Tax=Oreochromis niloticus TaxID=8128 RepID=A0A669B1F8_ORENI
KGNLGTSLRALFVPSSTAQCSCFVRHGMNAGGIRGQLWGQPCGQPWGQLWGQPCGQPWGQLWGQPWGQPCGQLWGQPCGQPWGQLWGQLWGQPWGQPWGQRGFCTRFKAPHLSRPKPIFLLFFSASSGSSAFFFSFSFPFALLFSFFFVFAFFFFSFLPFSSAWSPTPCREELLAGVSRPELGSVPSSGGEKEENNIRTMKQSSKNNYFGFNSIKHKHLNHRPDLKECCAGETTNGSFKLTCDDCRLCLRNVV